MTHLTQLKFVLVPMTVVFLVFGGCSSRKHTALMGDSGEGLGYWASRGVAASDETTAGSSMGETKALTGAEQSVASGEAAQEFLAQQPPLPRKEPSDIDQESLLAKPSSGLESVFTTTPSINEEGPSRERTGALSSPLTGIGEGDIEGFTSPSAAPEAVSPTGEDLFASLVDKKASEPATIASERDSSRREMADVFFDFDQALIRHEAQPVLETNADLLATRYHDLQLLIEGHCDERGTLEYNLVLGQRRADAAKRYLVDLGIPASRLETVTYGKEKPFCTASNPNCWQQNRRSHFVVR